MIKLFDFFILLLNYTSFILILYFLLLTKVYTYTLYSKQGRYWQIANPRFLVAWNSIKMRCSNTYFYVYLRKWSWNWGKFFSTALILSDILHKKCLNFAIIFLRKHKKLYFYISFLWYHMRPKKTYRDLLCVVHSCKVTLIIIYLSRFN